jgi:hypothetical protein
LASRIASSMSCTLNTGSTGPKTYSRTSRLSCGASSITVGM